MTVRKTIALALLLAAGAALAGEKSTPLKEAEVKAVIQAMDTALKKKDIEAALGDIAATAQIRIAVNSAQGPQILPLGRKEYGDVLATTLSDVTDYRIERKAPLVTLLKDGKALYTDLVTETIETKDKKTRNLNQERAVLERLDGKAKIIMLESSVIMSN